jgi:S1-C subfamily serine protease
MGAKDGDVLAAVGGQKVENLRQIFQFARETEGEQVEFQFQRGAETFRAKLPKADLQQPRRGR